MREASTGLRLLVDAGGAVRVCGDEQLYPVVVEGPGLADADAYLLDPDGGGRVDVARAEHDPPSFHVRQPETEGAADWILALSGLPDSGTVPAITLQGSGSERRRASRLSWSATGEHGLFLVTVLAGDGAQFVQAKFVLQAHCYLDWDSLQAGQSYRVIIREHDGHEVVRAVCELWLRPDGDGFPAEVSDITQIIRGLQSALSSGGAEGAVPGAILGLRSADDSLSTARGLCRALYEVIEKAPRIYSRPRAVNYPVLARMARQAAERADGSRYARDALGYLALYGVIDEYFTEQGLRDRAHIEDWLSREQAEALRQRLRASPAWVPDGFSSLMVDGLVRSAFDRDGAAESFARAREANPDFWEGLEIDVGASSYLSDAYLAEHAEETATRRRALSSSVAFLSPMPGWRGDEYMYVCSCDRMYFRVYFPVWLSIADYLKVRRMRFHFILCGEATEVGGLVDEARALTRTLAGLRGRAVDTYADNVSYSSIAVPEFVGDRRTFFAGARFLCARGISERYRGPLLISDIDFFFRDDPKRYLDAIDFDKVGVSARRGVDAVKPWRRVLGGTFVLPPSERALACLSSIEDYIVAGLPLTRNWMLDQNALNYMVERARHAGAEDQFADLNRMARPTVGEQIRTLCEAVQGQFELATGVAERPSLSPLG